MAKAKKKPAAKPKKAAKPSPKKAAAAKKGAAKKVAPKKAPAKPPTKAAAKKSATAAAPAPAPGPAPAPAAPAPATEPLITFDDDTEIEFLAAPVPDVERDPIVLAKLARDGDLQALFALCDGRAESDRDRLAYKWLCVAADFGHDDADNLIGDLMEATSLRYDDDQFATGNAHLELGVAYLTARDGLPRDLARGKEHLAEALQRHYPASVSGGDQILTELRGQLDAEAAAVFDAVFTAN
jgi:hypothetical protein